MADMQGAGRVGGHELHLDLFSLATVVVAESLALLKDCFHDTEGAGGTHEKVDEARARDFNVRHRVTSRQSGNQCLGQLPGRAAGRLGCDQGDIAGIITVRLVLGVAHLRCKSLIRGQDTFGLQGCKRRLEQVGNGFFHRVG